MNCEHRMDVDEQQQHETASSASAAPPASASFGVSVSAIAVFEDLSRPLQPFIVAGANLRSQECDTVCLLLFHAAPVPPAPVRQMSRTVQFPL